MNKILRVFGFLLSTIVVLTAQTTEDLIEKNAQIDTNKVITAWDLHPEITKTIQTILERYHFKKVDLNDSVSSLIFDEYIDRLDNNRIYFTEKDINDFKKFRTELDDNIKSGSLYSAYFIFNRFKKNLTKSIPIIDKILAQGFDFSRDEQFELDRSKANFPKTDKEVYELWRTRLKNDALNLKLNGKEYNDIQKTLTNRYHQFHKFILQYDAEDVFQLFINSFTYNIDPHTSYFSPKTSDDFKINMSLSLEGIGATLSNQDDYTTIMQIIPGGPASQSGILKEEDKIVAVAQGKTGEWVDVVGWRVDDVVQLIRGKKGTIVRLQILHGDMSLNSKPIELELVRDKIKLTERAAKADTIDIKLNNTNFKIGVIKVPDFYTNYGNTDEKSSSTTEDVQRLLNDLKKAKVDGVIIDLRNNGGGSLPEAIEMSGLFIKEGPIVQIKNSTGRIDIEKDPNPNITFEKPVLVLVNRYSASASEIFAGMIQDYGRGLIIGEQTYGKGTVQNLIGLDKLVKETPQQQIGSLKMTIAKFYRVTGSSTQNKGVIPDISFPSVYDPKESGESSIKSALPWDKIVSSQFPKYDDLTNVIPVLEKNYKERIKNNPEFKYIYEDIDKYNKTKNQKFFSLNEKERKKERDENDKIKEIRKVERENFKKDEDPFLSESKRILSDFILQTRKK